MRQIWESVGLVNEDNLQVRKGVKVAFLDYAFAAEDKICQIVLVISSKTHFTLDDRSQRV